MFFGVTPPQSSQSIRCHLIPHTEKGNKQQEKIHQHPWKTFIQKRYSSYGQYQTCIQIKTILYFASFGLFFPETFQRFKKLTIKLRTVLFSRERFAASYKRNNVFMLNLLFVFALTSNDIYTNALQ